VSEKFELAAGLCWRSESCPRLRSTAELKKKKKKKKPKKKKIKKIIKKKKKKKPAGQKIQYNRERQREQPLILQNNLQAIQLI